jgi:hypothetical protein
VTDDLTPDPPDRRDEHVAELLEVPPLDEVTRRRLVTNALDATAPATTPATTSAAAPRGRRLLAIAAAALAVVAVGAGVLVVATNDDGGSGTSTVAGRPQAEKDADAGTGESGEQPTTAPAPEAVHPAAGDEASTLSTLRNLGDLGDVTDPNRLRAAVNGGLAGQAPNRQANFDVAAQPCAANPPAGEVAPIAVGSGRFENDAVVILVVPKALDSYEVTVLDAATCTPRSTVTL